jgi:spore germination protein KA
MLEMEMVNRPAQDLLNKNVLEALQDKIIAIAELKTVDSLAEICHHISSGDTVLLVDGYAQGLVAGTRSGRGGPSNSGE